LPAPHFPGCEFSALRLERVNASVDASGANTGDKERFRTYKRI
jgi:hypothetical protein